MIRRLIPEACTEIGCQRWWPRIPGVSRLDLQTRACALLGRLGIVKAGNGAVVERTRS